MQNLGSLFFVETRLRPCAAMLFAGFSLPEYIHTCLSLSADRTPRRLVEIWQKDPRLLTCWILWAQEQEKKEVLVHIIAQYYNRDAWTPLETAPGCEFTGEFSVSFTRAHFFPVGALWRTPHFVHMFPFLRVILARFFSFSN